DLDVERLDQRVREELPGEPLDDRPRAGLRVGRHAALDTSPDPDIRDAGGPEMSEAALDRAALRIEDPVLRPDVHREADVHVRRRTRPRRERGGSWRRVTAPHP